MCVVHVARAPVVECWALSIGPAGYWRAVGALYHYSTSTAKSHLIKYWKHVNDLDNMDSDIKKILLNFETFAKELEWMFGTGNRAREAGAKITRLAQKERLGDYTTNFLNLANIELKRYIKDALMLKDHSDNLRSFITQVREVNHHLEEQYVE
ncbi:hypothetical protein GP486_006758 [Trichoglossum hirsutum]|uniref:Uncharacterized protein n=1 Tax=Trichoglossum hirsutum TaxID=265104 RepID=A0A9P8ID51_9PEZI|nr:hypothetical protein GP486_006758 [Trichoglossum hirsutum]